MDPERADRLTTDPGRAERCPYDGPEPQLCLHRDVLPRGRFSRSSGFPGSLVESAVLVVGRVFSQHTADVHLQGGVR